MSGQADILSILAMLRPYRSAFRKVRVGSLGDGGYVLPDDLDGISDLLSIGIGAEVSFDLHFAKQGVPVYQYDPTIERPPVAHEQFQFHKIAWGPEDKEGMSTIAGMVARHRLAETNDAILKFDTEGAEWLAMRVTTADALKNFRIIAMELHGLNNLHNREFNQQVRQILTTLTRYHSVVHLHANNCCGISLVEGVPVPTVIELTLLRNDRSSFSVCHDPIPGPLDYPNMPDRPDLVLTPFV
jgi:hypothetical protein